MIIVCLFTMCMISWQLTVFVLILLPIAGTIMGRVGKKLKRKSLENQNQWGVLMSNIEETLGGLRIIKAFNAEEKVRNRFHKENQQLYNLSNKVARRQALAHPIERVSRHHGHRHRAMVRRRADTQRCIVNERIVVHILSGDIL